MRVSWELGRLRNTVPAPGEDRTLVLFSIWRGNEKEEGSKRKDVMKTKKQREEEVGGMGGRDSTRGTEQVRKGHAPLRAQLRFYLSCK